MNKAHYTGTALGIRVKPSQIVNCQAIIVDAMSRGETGARTIKTAFKKHPFHQMGYYSMGLHLHSYESVVSTIRKDRLCRRRETAVG